MTNNVMARLMAVKPRKYGGRAVSFAKRMLNSTEPEDDSNEPEPGDIVTEYGADPDCFICIRVHGCEYPRIVIGRGMWFLFWCAGHATLDIGKTESSRIRFLVTKARGR